MPTTCLSPATAAHQCLPPFTRQAIIIGIACASIITIGIGVMTTAAFVCTCPKMAQSLLVNLTWRFAVWLRWLRWLR